MIDCCVAVSVESAVATTINPAFRVSGWRLRSRRTTEKASGVRYVDVEESRGHGQRYEGSGTAVEVAITTINPNGGIVVVFGRGAAKRI